MNLKISDNIWNNLVCSFCKNTLQKTDAGAHCLPCNTTYHYTDSGSLDLRLKQPKKYLLEFKVGVPVLPDNQFRFEPLAKNPYPAVDYATLSTPVRLSENLLSYIPKAQHSDSLMLDLGCGDGIHKAICEHAGFEWVGLDYSTTQGQITGDAQALPFKSNSFAFVLSIAMLQQISVPAAMMQEVYRVLKPGGTFIGTVSFLEPFHGNSLYHYTHLGIFNSLQQAGFTIEKIAPHENWPVLVAQSHMGNGLFPKMPDFIANALIFPIQLLHQLWWAIGHLFNPKANPYNRILFTTGAFTFIARKTQ